MELSWIITILLSISGLAYIYIKWAYSYWSRKGVPTMSNTVFPYGDMKDLGKKEHFSTLLTRMYNKFKNQGKFGGIYMSTRPVALITDLELIKTITIKDFDKFCNKGHYYNEKDDPVSAHLLNLEDDHWRTMRNKLTPTFTSGKIKTMFSTVQTVCDNMLKKIDEDLMKSKYIEVRDMMGKFTTDVIGTTAFGIDCNSFIDPNSEFYQIGQGAGENPNFLARFLMSSYPRIARFLRLKVVPQKLAEFYSSVVKDTINYREKHSVKRNDFMNLMIQMKNSKASDNLTVNQIVAQSFIFFLAGYETTATTLTFCLYELANHLDIQTKARNQIKEVLEEHNGEFSYEAISAMTYLDQIVNESLRKYPPAPLINRVCCADYKVPGTNITWDKGIGVLVPIYSIHHDHEIYPNPEKYDPERFTPEEEAKRHPCSFIPFGSGPRTCIGMRFAILEAKIALAKLLHYYTLEGTVPIKTAISRILTQPTGDVMIKMSKI